MRRAFERGDAYPSGPIDSPVTEGGAASIAASLVALTPPSQPTVPVALVPFAGHEPKGAGVEQTEEEGWYTDPYGLHEARWMSMGKPTKLVRDGELESYDELPDSAPDHPAELNLRQVR